MNRRLDIWMTPPGLISPEGVEGLMKLGEAVRMMNDTMVKATLPLRGLNTAALDDAYRKLKEP